METDAKPAGTGTVGADVRPWCGRCNAPVEECVCDNILTDSDIYGDDEPECDCGGDYAPGTEECDFCRWSDVCAGVEGPNEKVEVPK